jgi:hypothetical protein
MLIVDAQNPHLEKQQAEPEPSSDCGLQRGRRAQGDGRSGRHGRVAPWTGSGWQPSALGCWKGLRSRRRRALLHRRRQPTIGLARDAGPMKP